MILPWLFYYNDYFVHYWLKDNMKPMVILILALMAQPIFQPGRNLELLLYNHCILNLKNNTVEHKIFCTYKYHGIIQHTSCLCNYHPDYMSYEPWNFHGFGLIGYKSDQIKSYHTHKHLLAGNYWVIPHCIYSVENR